MSAAFCFSLNDQLRPMLADMWVSSFLDREARFLETCTFTALVRERPPLTRQHLLTVSHPRDGASGIWFEALRRLCGQRTHRDKVGPCCKCSVRWCPARFSRLSHSHCSAVHFHSKRVCQRRVLNQHVMMLLSSQAGMPARARPSSSSFLALVVISNRDATCEGCRCSAAGRRTLLLERSRSKNVLE